MRRSFATPVPKRTHAGTGRYVQRGGTGATCAPPALRAAPLRDRPEARDKISLYGKRKVVFPDDDEDSWGRATVTIVTTTCGMNQVRS